MNPAALELEFSCSDLSELTPGTIILPGVPLFDGAIEIGAPADHPRTTLDILVEHDLIEIRRSDQHPFNVHHYRRGDPPGGIAQPYPAFHKAVTEVIFLRVDSGHWHADGKDLVIIDSLAAESFVKKIGEVSVMCQQNY